MQTAGGFEAQEWHELIDVFQSIAGCCVRAEGGWRRGGGRSVGGGGVCAVAVQVATGWKRLDSGHILKAQPTGFVGLDVGVKVRGGSKITPSLFSTSILTSTNVV